MTAESIRYIKRWATDYVTDTVTADVDLGEQQVFMAVMPYPGPDPEDDDWHEVEWLGDDGPVRNIRLNIGPDGDVDLDVGDYAVFRWIKDTSTRPGDAICLLRIT